MVKIYCLIDPNTENVFYVGATIKPLKLRLSQHLSRKAYSYPGSPEWYKIILIEDIRKAGKLPVIQLLKEVPADEANWWEQYYYSVFTFYGFKLYQYPSYFYKHPVIDNQ
jgi:hypothetical protein